jgi:hypothetical protein
VMPRRVMLRSTDFSCKLYGKLLPLSQVTDHKQYY